MARLAAAFLSACIMIAFAPGNAAPVKKPRKKAPVVKAAPTPVPGSRLISRVSELPDVKRHDLQAADSSAPLEASTPGEDVCRQRAAGRVTPCLGIPSAEAEARDFRIRFELSRAITGAPKGALFASCDKGGSDCESDLQNDQEKLADMLNRGKRTPQAAVGLELKF